jgi:outer membrane putative beta-barrel porin/alpha-amylase
VSLLQIKEHTCKVDAAWEIKSVIEFLSRDSDTRSAFILRSQGGRNPYFMNRKLFKPAKGRLILFNSRMLPTLTLAAALTRIALATENTPRPAFAEWADVPALGQLVVGGLYEQSEAYYVWEGHQRHNITVHATDGEYYGIDIRQGYLTLDYGITKKLAADFDIGVSSIGWRSFDPGAGIEQTTGMMDFTLGIRYQLIQETTNSAWLPTLTVRLAGILPGTYDKNLAFAPGNHVAAIEPSILLRKHVAWTGFGIWGDALFRWMDSPASDQYIAAFGLFQQIRRWELDVGYRHLQAITGQNIVLIPPATGNPPPWDGIYYPQDVREISDAIDAGFSYLTRKNWRWSFHARKIFDGSNTDSKLWLGGAVEIPVDHLFGRGKEAK